MSMTAREVTQATAPDIAVRQRAVIVLGEVFSSKVRAALLAWVTPRLETRFSLTELSRELGMPISSLQHECYKLERLGVLKGRREGASRRYGLDPGHRLSRPLIGMVIAALGLDAVLREAVSGHGQVDLAVIAGPEPGSGSDRLLLVLVGEVDLEGLDQAQRRAALVLGVDPDRLGLAWFQREDWERGGGARHPFVARLAGRPIQPIAGDWPPG